MYKWFLNIKQKVFGLSFFGNNLAFEKLFASNTPLGVSSDFTKVGLNRKLRLTLFFYPTSLRLDIEWKCCFLFWYFTSNHLKIPTALCIAYVRFICSLFICSWFVPVKHWISAIFAGKKYSIVSYILDKIGVNEKTFCGESKTDYWRDVLVLKFRKTKWRLLSLFLIVPKQISLSWLQLKEI